MKVRRIIVQAKVMKRIHNALTIVREETAEKKTRKFVAKTIVARVRNVVETFIAHMMIV